MDKKKICVVIPIYKESLNDYEIQSVEQCIRVLSDYTIHFVCPQGLNIDFYKENFLRIENFTFFDNNYFKDITGYNRLMLSVDFYKKFDKYQYMLIHQTDCYVFRDELLDWANKNYDYIGGVWFEGYQGDTNLLTKIWYPGNGGLSLRKTKTMIKILSSKLPLKSYKVLLLEKKERKKNGKFFFLKELIILSLNIFGYKNSFNYFAKMNKVNEDVFFMEVNLKYKKIIVPNVEEAISFAWDRSPAFLFDKLRGLPFACHAWYREDHCYLGNMKFWSKHINCD